MAIRLSIHHSAEKTVMIVLAAGNASEWTGPTGNNTYLLPGRVPALIDAGVGNPAHIDAISRALGGQPLELVLITHGHVDHASGAPSLVSTWPGVRIRQLGSEPNGIAEHERIPAGDSSLVAVATPGHSPDHCCFFEEEIGDLYCGDLVRVGGTIVIPATRGGDLAQYLDSLRRVRDLQPRRLLPGHGPLIDDPVAVIDAYLRHRAERESQILAAVADGCRTPEQIVGRVYGNLSPSLLTAAADSVLAHLIKLEREGRLVQRDSGWYQAG
jgi:glyoxylase-like metal-dependent hydrolase (beta-lactamase superfamily II)